MYPSKLDAHNHPIIQPYDEHANRQSLSITNSSAFQLSHFYTDYLTELAHLLPHFCTDYLTKPAYQLSHSFTDCQLPHVITHCDRV